MKYLPFEHLIYKTDLSEKEAIKKLSDCIETKKRRFGNASNKEYEGFINENSFEINRIIRYRNSFLPQITGTVQRNNSETEIEIKMRLNLLVLVFMIFWCSFVIFFLIAVLTQAEKISVAIFIPFFMLSFAYLLTMFGFKSESKKSKEDLKKIFEAK
ncbi:hypothetical protein GCM10023210_42070 [Chryseobacterium ginsengisoli]|uniref:Competence protein n=1 Tax=Chryseobacterium ginsengisoli TaxID=363853 RepID=A0ABP9MWF6_9FLAO